MKYRKCECGKQFKTSNNSTSCSSCSYQRNKRKCPDCGAPMDGRVEQCRACWIASDGKTAAMTGRKGPEHPAWRGGRRKTSGGYVTVWVPEGHPRRFANDGHVPEHTLVMEKVLGRYLLPGETAHHKNGVRDDNRPSNLELWVTSQPKGQRAVDLVAWAREIIDRYGDLV